MMNAVVAPDELRCPSRLANTWLSTNYDVSGWEFPISENAVDRLENEVPADEETSSFLKKRLKFSGTNLRC